MKLRKENYKRRGKISLKKKKMCSQVLRKDSLIPLKFPQVRGLDSTSALIVSTTKQTYAVPLITFSEIHFSDPKPCLGSKQFICKNMGVRDISKNMTDAFMHLHIGDSTCVAFAKYLPSFFQPTGTISLRAGRRKHKQANELKERGLEARQSQV